MSSDHGYKYIADYQQSSAQYSAQNHPPHDDSQDAYNSHCALFEFIIEALILGTLCALGFICNTISYVVLWQERHWTATTCLLQAILIADIGIIWMLFVGDVVPSLRYVLPLLQHCDVICHYVTLVTKPMLFLAQILVIWFTLLAVFNRYYILYKPAHSGYLSTLEAAKKQLIVTITLAVVFVVPLTFDGAVTLSSQGNERQTTSLNSQGRSDRTVALDLKSQGRVNATQKESLRENVYYRTIYIHALTLFIVYILPLLVLLYLAVKLSMVMQSVKRLRRCVAVTHKSQNMDMTQVLLTLSICIFICYIPVVSMRITEWVDHKLQFNCGQLQYYLDSFSKMFMCMNSCLKFLVLYLFSRRFKDTLKTVFCKPKPKRGRGAAPQSDSIFDFTSSVYKCPDMSEMTLMSNIDTRH